MEYTIKQMAEMFGVSQHTVRYYTDLNLLPCLRDDNNRRIFTEESVNWMHGIMCLKGCGASLDEIKEYCRLCLMEESERNLRQRYEIILRQKQKAYQKLKEAKEAVDFIESKTEHYENILKGKLPDDTNPQKWTKENRPKHDHIEKIR